MKSFIHTLWFKKTVIASACVVAVATPITLLSVNWTNISIIYAAGSSAVAPLLTDIAATYPKFNRSNNIEINILATGSGNGLESVVNNTKNFGNVSWGPDKSKITNTAEVKALDSWTNNRIKTLTLGIDGIGIIYKPPGNNQFELDINKDNIVALFEAVAGTKSHTFGDLSENGGNTPINPYARTGGSAKSGTTDAFLKDSGFKIDKNAQYYKNLSNGQYGPGVESTRESNVETWKQVSSNGGQTGALTYLSAGFIINNLKAINDAGFKVAKYNTFNLDPEKVTRGYNWYRPLNVLFSLKNATPSMKEWVDWFYSNYTNDILTNAIKKAGVVPLTKTQLETMAKIKGDKVNPWVSDFELYPYDAAPVDFKWGAQVKGTNG